MTVARLDLSRVIPDLLRTRKEARFRLKDIRTEIETKNMEILLLRAERKRLRAALKGVSDPEETKPNASTCRYHRPPTQEQIQDILAWMQGRGDIRTGDLVNRYAEAEMAGLNLSSIRVNATQRLVWLASQGLIIRIRHGLYKLPPQNS